jgi:hypothetical protein
LRLLTLPHPDNSAEYLLPDLEFISLDQSAWGKDPFSEAALAKMIMSRTTVNTTIAGACVSPLKTVILNMSPDPSNSLTPLEYPEYAKGVDVRWEQDAERS